MTDNIHIHTRVMELEKKVTKLEKASMADDSPHVKIDCTIEENKPLITIKASHPTDTPEGLVNDLGEFFEDYDRWDDLVKSAWKYGYAGDTFYLSDK